MLAAHASLFLFYSRLLLPRFPPIQIYPALLSALVNLRTSRSRPQTTLKTLCRRHRLSDPLSRRSISESPDLLGRRQQHQQLQHRRQRLRPKGTTATEVRARARARRSSTRGTSKDPGRNHCRGTKKKKKKAERRRSNSNSNSNNTCTPVSGPRRWRWALKLRIPRSREEEEESVASNDDRRETLSKSGGLSDIPLALLLIDDWSHFYYTITYYCFYLVPYVH